MHHDFVSEPKSRHRCPSLPGPSLKTHIVTLFTKAFALASCIFNYSQGFRQPCLFSAENSRQDQASRSSAFEENRRKNAVHTGFCMPHKKSGSAADVSNWESPALACFFPSISSSPHFFPIQSSLASMGLDSSVPEKLVHAIPVHTHGECVASCIVEIC
ncbi:hypothetical protein KC345_g298 [Hortaea werneckii]|nr:hypothetical protein KC345_g298 [Hortaea werneckii]